MYQIKCGLFALLAVGGCSTSSSDSQLSLEEIALRLDVTVDASSQSTTIEAGLDRLLDSGIFLPIVLGDGDSLSVQSSGATNSFQTQDSTGLYITTFENASPQLLNLQLLREMLSSSTNTTIKYQRTVSALEIEAENETDLVVSWQTFGENGALEEPLALGSKLRFVPISCSNQNGDNILLSGNPSVEIELSDTDKSLQNKIMSKNLINADRWVFENSDISRPTNLPYNCNFNVQHIARWSNFSQSASANNPVEIVVDPLLANQQIPPSNIRPLNIALLSEVSNVILVNFINP